MFVKNIKFFDELKAELAIANEEVIEFADKTIVLASASITRRRIMEEADIPFVVIKNTLDEEKIKCDITTNESAEEYVKVLAYEKAMTLKPYLKNAIIISADTIAYCDGEKIGKPKDEADAYRILNKLSGSVHSVITGICIIDDDIENFTVTSKITMKEFPKIKIDELVKNEKTYLYAGGYCIDDNIEGYAMYDDKDFNNIKGLPIEKIIKLIKCRDV